MHICVSSRKIIDRHFRPARGEVKNDQNKVIEKGEKEVTEKSHREVVKVFAEPDPSEVVKNRGVEGLDYYEVIAELGKARLVKIAPK